jgi:pimeloyl-ACP methyl ester carboxylesterase
MAGGFAVTKEPGTDRFAERFNRAGYTVVAFDYRHLGESGGQPRQVVRIGAQLADWDAAISFASTLPGGDESRIAIWGFSLSGGHVFRVAARHPELAAAIAQAPNADGRAATRNAMRHTTRRALLRLTGCGILDLVGGLLGREPRLVPLAGAPGTVAVLSTPDALDADKALNPENTYPEWQQAVAARSVLRLGSYRPGRGSSRIQCPLLVVAYEDDASALAAPAARAAERAPRGELVVMPGGHYEAFMDGHARTAQIELSFLRQHLFAESAER